MNMRKGLSTRERPRASVRSDFSAIQTTLNTVLSEKMLRFKRSHAARPGSGDGLAIHVIMHVSGREHSLDVSPAAIFDDQIAFGIHVELSLKYRCIRIMPDAEKYPIYL